MVVDQLFSFQVTYVFETSNVIHSPDTTVFQEKWLDAIINSKLKILKRFVFSVCKFFINVYFCSLRMSLAFRTMCILYNNAMRITSLMFLTCRINRQRAKGQRKTSTLIYVKM